MNHSNRIKCQNCSKDMVPRMSFRDGEPYKSFCPFCGEEVEAFSVDLDILILLVFSFVYFLIAHFAKGYQG
ncbi:MAG: hypothetical protein OQK04_15965 [Kangiellaceae bacterium]|nr:hypothetical protein [Kangiellaceae bacterium]MCW9000204.1 hypothetical protein [Kangiellaceae bacterium]